MSEWEGCLEPLLKFQVSGEALLLVRMRWELLQTTYDLVIIQDGSC